MSNATLESREELVDSYVLGHAIETLIGTFTGSEVSSMDITFDGPPFLRLFPDPSALQNKLDRLALDEWSKLWPEDEMPPEYDKEQAAHLLAAQMLIAVAGHPSSAPVRLSGCSRGPAPSQPPKPRPSAATESKQRARPTMPDTLTIPEQVTISGDVLYQAIRDVAEVREYILATFTDWTDTRLTEQLFGVVEALSKPLGGLYVVGGASDGELMPCAAQFRRESYAAVAGRLEDIASSVRHDEAGTD